jgi:hypothetical protein
MKAKHKMLLAVLAAIAIGGCSTGGTKATSHYPVIKFVDPVTEEVPNVTVD